MKIFNFGLDIEPKKYSYEDSAFKKLIEKFAPKKKNPYTLEIIASGWEAADLIVTDKSKVVDLCLDDLGRIEQRQSRTEDNQEKQALAEAQAYLEAEKLLFYCTIKEEYLSFLKKLQLVSLKPVLVKKDFQALPHKVIELIGEALTASERILFYTASEKEVKAWDLKKGKSVLEAAGKIHSDLRRGFIRAEVVNIKNLNDFYNIAEAKSKGLVKTVDRDYIVESGDIVYIKFSV